MGRPKKQPEQVLSDALARVQRERPDWMAQARCRALAPEVADGLFFDDANVKDPMRAARRAYCGACPVQVECRTYGDAVHPDYGSWGGYSAAERRLNMRYKGRRPPTGAHRTESRW